VPVKAYLIAIPTGSQVIHEVNEPIYFEIDSYIAKQTLSRLGSAADLIPGKPFEVTSTGFLRDYRVMGIRVSPLVYDRASGGLRIYQRFRVSLRFDGGQAGPRFGARSGAASRVSPEDEVFYGRTILNYEQAKPWRRRPVLRAENGDYFTSSSNWLKIGIDSTGVYCLTGRDLEDSGVPAGTIDANTLRLYGGGGLPLKESLAEHNPDWMRMAAIKVVDDGDGSIGLSDSILFYGLGMHDWANLYDPDIEIGAHYGSFFSDRNFYWLTWGGALTEPAKRMETVEAVECDGCAYYQPGSFLERVHVEEDVFSDFSIRADDGWYWRVLRLSSTSTVSVPTPHPDVTREATVKVRIGLPDIGDQCRAYYYRVVLRLNGKALEDSVWKASQTSRRVVDLYQSDTLDASEYQDVQVYLPRDIPDNKRICGIEPLLAWVDLFYWREFVSDGQKLFFLSPDHTGTARYVVSGFDTPALYVFDLTDQFDAREIIGFEISGGPDFSISFYDTVSEGSLKRYAAVSSQALLEPAEIGPATIGNIRYGAARPYIVITHDDLVDAADIISDYHDGQVVTVQQIYDEFGWGVPDVTAIRDFLRWRYERGQVDEVLLLGDATWDYKDYLSLKYETYRNYVPSYERRYRQIDSYNTDDWLAYLEPASDGQPVVDSTAYYPTIPISRLPATSPDAALFLVEQAIDYMANPELGSWQSRIILVADDDRVPGPGDPCDRINHVGDLEIVNRKAYPAVFER
jgi:hypothetical protein